MRIPSGLFILITSFHVTDALFSGEFCPSACDLTLNYVTFNDTEPWLSKKIRSCRSGLRVTSSYLCFNQYCADDGSGANWIAEQNLWCEKHAGVRLPDFHDVVGNWTEHDVASIRRLDVDEAKSSPVINQVVLPESHFLDRAFITMVCYVSSRRSNMKQLLIVCDRVWPYNSTTFIWYMGRSSQSSASLGLTITAGTCTTFGSLS